MDKLMDCVFVWTILSETFSFVINLLWIPGNPHKGDTKEHKAQKRIRRTNDFYQCDFFCKESTKVALKTIS